MTSTAGGKVETNKKNKPTDAMLTLIILLDKTPAGAPHVVPGVFVFIPKSVDWCSEQMGWQRTTHNAHTHTLYVPSVGVAMLFSAPPLQP